MLSDHRIYAGEFAVDFVITKERGEKQNADASLPERTTYYSAEEFQDVARDDDKPMLVVLHGLSGGSHEVYLRQVVAPVTAKGWECCVVSGSPEHEARVSRAKGGLCMDLSPNLVLLMCKKDKPVDTPACGPIC
jgi:hypothetical protein